MFKATWRRVCLRNDGIIIHLWPIMAAMQTSSLAGYVMYFKLNEYAKGASLKKAKRQKAKGKQGEWDIRLSSTGG